LERTLAGGPEDIQELLLLGELAVQDRYAPSLDVLGRLAELYECSIGDLLVDYGDFRDRDAAYTTRRQLDSVPEFINGATVNGSTLRRAPDLAPLIDRLEEMDVHELARFSATWADQLDGVIDRRALLLKLSAGLGLAAVLPNVAEAEASPANTPSNTSADLTGIWHSHYVYFSNGRQRELEGEHYVVLRGGQGRFIGESLPNTTESVLRLELSVDGLVATGTWVERTTNWLLQGRCLSRWAPTTGRSAVPKYDWQVGRLR
jgi:hypothetical protein